MMLFSNYPLNDQQQISLINDGWTLMNGKNNCLLFTSSGLGMESYPMSGDNVIKDVLDEASDNPKTFVVFNDAIHSETLNQLKEHGLEEYSTAA